VGGVTTDALADTNDICQSGACVVVCVDVLGVAVPRVVVCVDVLGVAVPRVVVCVDVLGVAVPRVDV